MYLERKSGIRIQRCLPPKPLVCHSALGVGCNALCLAFDLLQQGRLYQARVRNIVISSESIVTTDVDEAMWKLFVAIGDSWNIND